MNSIKSIFKIGNGPSSSHTMGPSYACDYILNKYKNIKSIEVNLYHSLALTGKGHLTDYIIKLKFKDYKCKINFIKNKKVPHPNYMVFKVNTDEGEFIDHIVSIGGGSLLINGQTNEEKDIYPLSNLKDILTFCKENNLSIVEFIKKYEDEDIYEFILNIYEAMKNSIKEGYKLSGYLPGELKVNIKAKELYENYLKSNKTDYRLLVIANAFAVSELNASGGVVVTAPTCGSCGIIPSIITYLEFLNVSKEKILDGLLVSGLIGLLAKTNASISGAECGCQAEIGVATSMASALITYCLTGDNLKIAQASEIALEHSLGLTCDPIKGYVQIPCIERNAVFALKAIDCSLIAINTSSDSFKISFDECLKTMYETGIDLQKGYKETSILGLSKLKI
ncbi:MAG: L-serine ammonia-lyase, iron-sulfur-dependent, subunit alpha [Bacilli bacterium]